MKNRIFLPSYQSLDLSFKCIHPQFITLASILPSNIQIPFHLKTYSQTVYLLQDHQPPLQPQACQGINKFEQVINQNIRQLLSMNKLSYIQCLAHTFKDYGLQLKNFNFGKTILQTSKLRDLTEYVGIQFIKKLLYCYNIILKYQDSYFQVTGIPFSQQFGFKNFLEKKKKNVSKSIYNYTNQTINRFQMLYCNHMNRNSGIFRKNIFFQQGIRKSMYFQQVTQLSEKIVSQMFPRKIIKTQKQYKQLQNNIFALLTNARTFFQQQKYAPKKIACKFDLYLSRYCRLPKNYQQIKQNVHKFIRNEYEGTPQQIFESMYSNNSSYDQVYQLLKYLLRKIVPQTFLGKQNLQIFLSMLKEFISMKRFQNYKIQDFLYRMDVFKIPWLRINYNKKYKKQIIGRGRRVLAALITFLYNKFIIPILKYNFFITQKHKQANKLFYYRKPLWILIQKLALKRFSDQNLTPINQGKLNQTRKNGIDYPQGKLRLMPKKGSFRPIITFNRKRKVQGDFYKATLNQILSDTQLVLRNLKNILGSQKGYCIFDNRQISHKYDGFVQKWRNQGCKELVYFTLDIKKCYDSINTNKLVQMIQKTPYIQQMYLLVKYLRIYRNKKPLNQVKNIPYYFNFKERVHATSLQNDPIRIYQQSQAAINIFPAKQKLLARDQIIKKLKQLCAGSIVSYKKQYWLQNWGIPQGLNVSGVLCSLYFSQLQKQFIDVREGLLMRLTDDYAYIGPQKQAVQVLTGLLQCADANRFTFNADKITKNFHHPRLDKITKQEQFLWIGKKINIRTLQMSPAFQISSQKLAYAMNVNINKKHIKSFLKNKLKSLLTNHFSAYFKPHLFEFDVLVVNVRLYCKISLAKFFPFLISLNELKVQNQTGLILKILQVTIHEFLIYACSFIQESQRHVMYHKFLLVVLQEFKQFFKKKRSFKFLRQIQFVFNERIKKLKDS